MIRVLYGIENSDMPRVRLTTRGREFFSKRAQFEAYKRALASGNTLIRQSQRKRVLDIQFSEEELMKRIDLALREIKDPAERKKVSDKAGQLVAAAASGLAPRSRKPHFRYRTAPKAVNSLRAKRGSRENDRIQYLSGNLQLSIQVITRLRRAVRTVIGPKIASSKSNAKTYGKNKRNTDAYYAQFIYGSAVAFKQKIMETALQTQASRVKRLIERGALKLVRKGARNANLT
jgi:hypothetical protein